MQVMLKKNKSHKFGNYKHRRGGFRHTDLGGSGMGWTQVTLGPSQHNSFCILISPAEGWRWWWHRQRACSPSAFNTLRWRMVTRKEQAQPEKNTPKRQKKSSLGKLELWGSSRGHPGDQPSLLPSRWSSRRSLRSLPKASPVVPKLLPLVLKGLEGVKGSKLPDPLSCYPLLPRLPSRTNPLLFAGHFPAPKRCPDTRSSGCSWV